MAFLFAILSPEADNHCKPVLLSASIPFTFIFSAFHAQCAALRELEDILYFFIIFFVSKPYRLSQKD